MPIDDKELTYILDRTFSGIIANMYKLKPPTFLEVYHEMTSTENVEKVGRYEGMGKPVERERGSGAQVSLSSIKQGRAVLFTPMQFADGMLIPEEFIRLARNMKLQSERATDIMMECLSPWYEAFRQNRDDYLVKPFTDNPSIYIDGSETFFMPFGGSGHPDKVGNTYYNSGDPTTGANLLLTYDNLYTASYQLRYINNRTEMSLKMDNKPDILVVAPNLEKTAHEILSSKLKPGTANNDANFFYDYVADVPKLSLLVHDGLSDNQWFIGKRRAGLRTYNCKLFTVGTEYNLVSISWVAVAHEEWSYNVLDWRPWYQGHDGT